MCNRGFRTEKMEEDWVDTSRRCKVVLITCFFSFLFLFRSELVETTEQGIGRAEGIKLGGGRGVVVEAVGLRIAGAAVA